MTDTQVAIIGGGAAGLMAAGTSAALGKKTVVIEKNERCAKKVLITGKGRCNVTNNCEIDELMNNIPRNPRFLYSAFGRFSPRDTMEFFQSRGVALKTERGNRVFPESDSAADIARALTCFARESGAEIINDTACSLELENGAVKGVHTEKSGLIRAKSVIIATGGLSYPRTGSTGDGYRLAKQAGHSVTALMPSLIPVIVKEKWCKDLMGLSLKNITLTVQSGEKIVFKQLGELLFTHFGVSGPLILSASSVMKEFPLESLSLHIDLKPALSEKQLDARLLRDFESCRNKNFANSLGALLPRKLIPVAVKLSGIGFEEKINQINRENRAAFVSLLKDMRLTPCGYRPIEEAVITSGGVDVREINPKTMESRLANGLFFAGEVIDTDGFTGGFNLQIAFSTAVAAGNGC